MKVDQAGRIYTTGPGGLWVLDPAGAPLLHVALPEKATNCAWGNTDWRSLYITAGGSVYRLRCAVPGNPPPGARSR
jgi:gluconolactonase